MDAEAGKSKTEAYEDRAKELFKKQPANMRLLIVVDKLLTGFDAPSCTYLYIDKSMQDHGLFQAICRTNRLDGEDKCFGYIVDYKDLFKKVQGAMAVYTSELDDSDGGGSPEVMLEERLKKGRKKLDEALEALALLCEPVQPPKGDLQHIHYFCGNTEIPDDLKTHELQRAALYKATAALVRAYANITDDLPRAGYTEPQAAGIKQSVERYLKLRETIRQASGETLDLKAYEADMRHLIDTYIQADSPRTISSFGEIGLLELIVKSGIAEALNSLPSGIRGDKEAVAETIANNVRSKIIKDHLNDPAFYDRMSALLKEILSDLKAARISYEEFLKRIAERVIKPLQAGKADDTPAVLDTPGKRALFSNLKKSGHDTGDAAEVPTAYQVAGDPLLALALQVHEAVMKHRPNAWRGIHAREQTVKRALYDVLKDEAEVERLFLIVKAQTEY